MLVQADPDIAKRLLPPSSSDKTLVSFKTYFARPNMFRFDWKSSVLDRRSLPTTRSREASIWSDGRTIYKWMPTVATRDDSFTLSASDHLEMSIMEARSSSSTAVYPLISMFIKEANVAISFADILGRATELALLTEEAVDGEMCYVISANLSGAPWTIWIAKQRNVLRKTRTIYSYGSFDERVQTGVRHEVIAEETRSDIKINEPISRDVFQFRPKLQTHDLDATH